MTDKPRVRGWYAELPPELLEQFNRLYPHKGLKRVLTETMVRRAIMLKGEMPWEENKPTDTTQLPLPLDDVSI